MTHDCCDMAAPVLCDDCPCKSPPPNKQKEAAEALCLLAAYDERLQKLHDLLETIREQIRTGVEPEHRPKGLFQNIQDAVYAMRGRTLLMNDAAITGPLQVIAGKGTAESASPSVTLTGKDGTNG